MRYFMLTVFIAALSMAAPVRAQELYDITESGLYLFGFSCAPHSQVEQYLANRGEDVVATGRSIAIGRGRESGAVEFWRSEDGKTWTVVVDFPDVSCNIIHGTEWSVK